MTLGDRRLEREVLEIFVRQTVIMLERIAGAEPALAAAAAHTLTGSARGIGVWAHGGGRRGGVGTIAPCGPNPAQRPGLRPRSTEAKSRDRAIGSNGSAAIAARLGDVLRDH